MPNFTITEVPEELLKRLQERALLTNRSLSDEAIACLDLALTGRQKTAEELIAERKILWAAMDLKDLPPYDPAWKSEGRP